MSRFLPDDDETPEEEFGEAQGNEPPEEIKSETAAPNQLLKIVLTKLEARKRAMQPSDGKPGDGEEHTESGQGKGSGGGQGKQPGQGGGDGSGGGGGGSGAGNADEGSGGVGGVTSKPSVPIRARAFCQDEEARTYTLAVGIDAAQRGKSVHLVVSSVGDDQKIPAEIATARLGSGGTLTVHRGGVIGPFDLPQDSNAKIEVTLNSPKRLALEVSAHEA